MLSAVIVRVLLEVNWKRRTLKAVSGGHNA
jgi:hypothetical protein